MNDFHLYLYGPSRGPLPSSFEQAEQRLAELPRLHFEPDGSFVWALDSGQQQVFGMIYDAAGVIQYCELRGKCSYSTWRRLREAIGGPGLIGDSGTTPLEVLRLPDQQLQDLQSFEAMHWPEAFADRPPNS